MDKTVQLITVIKTVLDKTVAAEGNNMEAAFQLLDWLKDDGNNLMRDAIEKSLPTVNKPQNL